MGEAGANSLRAGIAVLDAEGVIRWTNHLWSDADGGAPFSASAREGSNLLALAKTEGGPLGRAIVAAIAAVTARATSYVELKYDAIPGRPMTVAITPTRNGGVVLLYVESGAGEPQAIQGAGIAEQLTTREREVLTRMTAGLSNREIATLLGIEYAIVRGDVESVLAKLGARSRVDAVAAAYRSGLAREADLVFDRESSRGPGDEPANDVGGLRESEVM